MMDDELMKIWQSSPNQEQVKFEKSRLMLDVQAAVESFDKGIKQRDFQEQVGALIGMPIFAYYAYSIPYVLSKIASVLIILFGVWVIYRLRKTKRFKPSPFYEAYVDYLRKTHHYLTIQKQLLDSVLYWYILPIATFIFLFTLGPGIEGRLPKIIGMAIGNVALAVVIYSLNKKAVKEHLVPRLKKIEDLIQIMENQ